MSVDAPLTSFSAPVNYAFADIALQILFDETGMTYNKSDLSVLKTSRKAAAYRFYDGESDKIIAMHLEYIDVYQKEKWVTSLLEINHLRVPKVHLVGEHENMGYAIIDFVQGTPVNEISDRHEQLRMFEQAGQLARQVNAIPVSGFGFVMRQTPAPEFVGIWQDEIECDLQRLFDSNILVADAGLTRDEFDIAHFILTHRLDWEAKPCLTHGAITASNLIRCEDNALVMLDWFSAQGLPEPVSEIGIFFARHDDQEIRDAFLRGYGLSLSEYESNEERIKIVELDFLLRQSMSAIEHKDARISLFIERAKKLIKEF